MSSGGKGSAPRPYSVDQKTFDDNWDKIFGKKLPDYKVKKPEESSKKKSSGKT